MDITQRARDLLASDAQIAEHLTAAVWERLPGYEVSLLDRTELSDAITASMRSVLLAVAEQRRPSDAELAPAQHMAERRAVQGVPIESLVGSWHNAERVLLSRLLATRGALTTAEVQDAARRVGVAVDAMIGASTAAYRNIASDLHAQSSQVGVDLVSSLAGAEALDPSELDRRASMVGVEAHLPHRAIALSVRRQDGRLVARAQRAIAERLRPHVAGRTLIGSHQGFTILVFADFARLVEVLERALRDPDVPASTALGVGDVRERFNETAGSLHEAVSALKVGRLLGRAVTRFDNVIPEVMINENPGLSAQMVGTVLGPLRKGDLLETLRTFLSSGLSTRATAAALRVHENTVAYRLRRICELLGIGSSAELVRVDVVLALRALELERDTEDQ
ncbi:PucR family transcriptional regulator [Kribbella sp. NPDC050124]|uniref:PucR family transcriptional regulator n=1 Tax=Kribbella sp. NPDC050124 TaxID=3364114 RepID=UPI00378E23E4